MWKEISAQHENKDLFNNYFKHSCEIIEQISVCKPYKTLFVRRECLSTRPVSDRLLNQIVKWSKIHSKIDVAMTAVIFAS